MAVIGGQADLRPAESTTSSSLPLFAEPRETGQPPTGQSHCNRNPPHTASADRRHTILTWVERRFGFAVAQAYAGHQDAARRARAMSATGTYVRAGLPEVATALAVLTGETHPLAPEGPGA